jgi:hypothetical protein
VKLEIEEVGIHELEQHPENANNGDIDAIAESIRVNGFFAPVLVQRSTRRILAGNHRWAAAIRLGHRTVPVVWLDVDDDAGRRIMVADNRTARLGRDDPALLLDLLDELYATDAGLAGSGFDYGDYSRLQDELRPPVAADAGDEYPVERDAEPPKEPIAEVRKRLPFSLLPELDEDGQCYSVTVTRVGMQAITARDFNDLRVALGAMPLTRDEVRSYEIPAWGSST